MEGGQGTSLMVGHAHVLPQRKAGKGKAMWGQGCMNTGPCGSSALRGGRTTAEKEDRMATCQESGDTQ